MKSLGGGYQASPVVEKNKCLPRDGCHAVFRFVTSKLTTACFSSEF